MWYHVSIHSSLVVTTASAAVSERKRIVVMVVVVRARRTMKTFAVVGRDFALGWGLLTSKSHRLESAVRETRILWQNHKKYFDLTLTNWTSLLNPIFHFSYREKSILGPPYYSSFKRLKSVMKWRYSLFDILDWLNKYSLFHRVRYHTILYNYI